ncbi:response regulator [Parasegetibacter sp. NRK P23]|uniref:response regulator n=1 Tax=Parasegetibacter sp. NRK P23 TaxID=2942999 RepID=UPI00204404E4|nr:response regulator [Parasegetibacter sp. NRK P23]MCM5530047.1 response regulator [Parasegetibacter sp. NRK P23]
MNLNTILIVDDDARNIFALSAVLKAKKFHCISAAGGGEALALLENGPHISVVLLDMMMPDIDGYELLSMIRGNDAFAHIPVIAVTAQAMVGDREKCLAAGADAYISKPVDVDALLELLQQHLK